MNESDIARAIASGELDSPARLGQSVLLAIRCSGTGFATRPSISERAYRARDTWLSPAMLQRMLGVPVILNHPPGPTLTADEYAARNVGSVVHSYVAGRDGVEDPNGPDLWGIGRLFMSDDEVDALGTSSTSPCAVFEAGAGEIVNIGDEPTFIEPPPLQVDHIALVVDENGGVGRGVWDKNSTDLGIRLERKLTMTEENTEEAADKRKDSTTEGVEPDKLLSLLDAISQKCDAMVQKHDTLSARFDALEAEGRARGETREMAADRSRRDASWRERDEAERKDGTEKADAQARADAVYMALGERAPPPMHGEAVLAYRQRLARPLRRHSLTFKDVDLNAIADSSAFGAVEKIVYTDALVAASDPTRDAPVNHLVMRTKVDEAGHQIREFYGRNGHTFFSELKRPSRYVTGFNTRPAA